MNRITIIPKNGLSRHSEHGGVCAWISVPQKIEPMSYPVKSPFSSKYSHDGICGAMDQGVSEGSDMTQTCVARGIPVKGGGGAKENHLGVRWRVEGGGL